VTIHPFRVVAGVLLTTGGLLVAVSALAIVLARILVAGGMVVRPGDAALLEDLTALLPFIVGFALANVVAALGLLGGRAWADNAAIGSAAIAVAIGTVGLLLVFVGRDPFGPAASTAGPSADGIEMLAGFTLLYLAVIVSLVAAHAPRRMVTMGATA
jgi:hypothetical protein